MANTADTVRSIVSPFAQELGLRIWDVRYIKEGASWFLRIFIDKDGGVTIEDCENFSRAIDQPLDDADPIKESYYLEISSAGLGRELTRPEHFESVKGSEIRIKLIRPKDGVREFEGVLTESDSEKITITTADGKQLCFGKNEISKACLNDDKDI